jgi:hypothetical protein
MDADENLPRRKDDLLPSWASRTSIPIRSTSWTSGSKLLEAEIARCKSKIQRAVNHRASADSLFKR